MTDHIRRIQAIVARRYGLTTVEMLAKVRTGTIVEARQVSAYLCRKLIDPTPSYPELSRSLLFADHTGARSCFLKVSDRLEVEPRFAARVASIAEEIAGPGVRKTEPPTAPRLAESAAR